jgi:DNA-directed RNA polymerase specialized sigma24 family protein
MGARVDNELLDCALNFLPDLERKVFLLYIFDDFSYKSLSDQSGIPKAEIYDIVNNAKRQVRRIIGIE